MSQQGAAILSHRCTRIKSLAPREHGYSEGFILAMHTEKGYGQIECDREEMLALLRVLPPELLHEVLQGQAQGVA
jgi:hypothetical protein